MGYIYEKGVLCCDSCEKAGAYKRLCPYGYCQPVALCHDCWKEKRKGRKERHQKCKEALKRHEDKIKLEKEMINNGELLKICALKMGDRVKMIFKGKDGEAAYFLPEDIYNNIPLGEYGIVTLTDCKYHPHIKPNKADSLNIYDNF